MRKERCTCDLDNYLDEAVWSHHAVGAGYGRAMAVVCLIVILMNAVFWSMKPEKTDADKDDTCNEFLKDPNQYT